MQVLLSGQRSQERPHKELKVFGCKAGRMADAAGLRFGGYVPSQRQQMLQNVACSEENNQQGGVRTQDMMLLVLGCIVFSNGYKGRLAEGLFRFHEEV